MDRGFGYILPRYNFSLLEAVEKKMRIEITTILQELSSALEHLHKLGFAHNDVHLGNIMVTDSGSAVLINLEFFRRIRVNVDAISRKSSIEHNISHFNEVKRALLAHEKG